MKQQQAQFEVIVYGGPTSLKDWQRAQEAATSDLPSLNEAQKEVAYKFGLTEEQYKRSYLSLLYGQERLRDRTESLGSAIQEILARTGKDYRVTSIAAQMDRERWIVEIDRNRQVVQIAIPRELGDDFLDSHLAEYGNKLAALVISGVS